MWLARNELWPQFPLIAILHFSKGGISKGERWMGRAQSREAAGRNLSVCRCALSDRSRSVSCKVHCSWKLQHLPAVKIRLRKDSTSFGAPQMHKNLCCSTLLPQANKRTNWLLCKMRSTTKEEREHWKMVCSTDERLIKHKIVSESSPEVSCGNFTLRQFVSFWLSAAKTTTLWTEPSPEKAFFKCVCREPQSCFTFTEA